MRHFATLPLVLCLSAGAMGAHCNAARSAARTVLEATAEGVATADAAVVEAYESSPCESTEDVEELRHCVSQLRQATEALQAARAAAREGESILDAWDHGATEPAEWTGWLTTIGQALARLVEVLELAGLDVPEELLGGAAALDAYLEDRRD